MCTELSFFQVVCGMASAVCLVGGIVSACAFFFALVWEYRLTSYQRTVRRYLSAQEALRLAWRA